MSEHVVWTFIHGTFFGGLFTLAFAAAVLGLFSTRAQWATADGVRGWLPGLRWATAAMAFFGWATVITGTWIVYPWYRAPVPPDLPLDRLKEYPREFLLSNPTTAIWHNLGMEWKEHVAWIAPIVATSVAFVVIYYGPRLFREGRMRNALITLLVIAFLTAAAASSLGDSIRKLAPV
jgi:hypothetical protein